MPLAYQTTRYVRHLGECVPGGGVGEGWGGGGDQVRRCAVTSVATRA